MVKPKLECLLSYHYLNKLERGFEVMKKTNLNRWVKRKYWFKPQEEKIYWNSKKIYQYHRNYIYPFEIRSMEKKNERDIHLQCSIYIPRNKYDKIEVIYKTTEWKFKCQEDRDEIFAAIQELRSQYQCEYSLFHKIK